MPQSDHSVPDLLYTCTTVLGTAPLAHGPWWEAVTSGPCRDSSVRGTKQWCPWGREQAFLTRWPVDSLREH